MLENWLKTVDTKNIVPLRSLSAHQWGKKVAIYEKDIPDLTHVRMAIVGIEEEAANAVRQHLYTMTSPDKKLAVADLGNFRKIHPEFAIPLLAELVENDIIPIIIGGHHAFTYAQYKAYQLLNQLVNIVVINERIAFTADGRKKDKDYFYLNKILNDKKHFLFNLSHLGHQTHFVDPKTLSYFDKRGFDCTRLGLIKPHLSEIEPVIRDADMLSFDISVLKQSEAPGHQLPSPSGIFSEDACQMAYYAGVSDKMTSVGFYGYHPPHDINGQTAQIVAQMIWYFADGYCKRVNDIPVNTDKFIRYAVNLNNHELIFWKSKKSERWWMQIPTIKKHKHDQLVPCSFADYQMACHDEIPDRFLNALKRVK